MRPEDREKFVKLATKRVNSVIKSITLIGNLSNKSNYDYTQEDVAKIFKALNSEISACKKRFDMASRSNDNEKFSL